MFLFINQNICCGYSKEPSHLVVVVFVFIETGPQLKVSSDRLVKSGIEPATTGLQGKRFIHYTTAPPLSHLDGSFEHPKLML